MSYIFASPPPPKKKEKKKSPFRAIGAKKWWIQTTQKVAILRQNITSGDFFAIFSLGSHWNIQKSHFLELANQPGIMKFEMKIFGAEIFCQTYAPAHDQCYIIKICFPRFPIVSVGSFPVWVSSFPVWVPVGARNWERGYWGQSWEEKEDWGWGGCEGGGWVEEGEEKERDVWRHPHSLAVSLSLLQGNIN